MPAGLHRCALQGRGAAVGVTASHGRGATRRGRTGRWAEAQWVGPLGLGEEGVSQVWEGGGLLKIYEVVYKIMLGLVLDSISPILRVQDPFREHCCR
jgi:hypothetical protein